MLLQKAQIKVVYHGSQKVLAETNHITTSRHFMPYIALEESGSPTEAENAVKRRQVIVGLITPCRAYPAMIGNVF